MRGGYGGKVHGPAREVNLPAAYFVEQASFFLEKHKENGQVSEALRLTRRVGCLPTKKLVEKAKKELTRGWKCRILIKLLREGRRRRQKKLDSG